MTAPWVAIELPLDFTFSTTCYSRIRRDDRILRARIEPCEPAVEEAALRRFAQGMARLATKLLLAGALDFEGGATPKDDRKP